MNTSQNYVLITGASCGIGYELAKLFSSDLHNLILVSRNYHALQKVADELQSKSGKHMVVIAKDLFKPENAFALYREVQSRGLNVEVLVNDAGQGVYGDFVDTDIERELSIINLNVASLVILTKLFLKDMIARGSGRILNLSSIASKMPGPLQAVYHGTKAFVQSFSEAIREEVKNTGVSVTALLPGATATDFFNKAGMQNAKIVREGKLADASVVAKDGYEALMKGEDMVVSGFKNKMEVAMSNIFPESAMAARVHKQQAPMPDGKLK